MKSKYIEGLRSLKLVHRLKIKNFVKAIITTINSEGINRRYKIGHPNYKMWGRGVKICRYFRMHLNLHDYQSKAVDIAMG